MVALHLIAPGESLELPDPWVVALLHTQQPWPSERGASRWGDLEMELAVLLSPSW